MKISSKTHYGVQILCSLATSEQPISAKELERHTGVSSKYLEKVLKILGEQNLISATRGKNGGYTLSVSPDKIYLGDAIRALEEDNMEIIGCVSGANCCCPSSILWKKLFDGINGILNKITLKDLVEGNI